MGCGTIIIIFRPCDSLSAEGVRVTEASRQGTGDGFALDLHVLWPRGEQSTVQPITAIQNDDKRPARKWLTAGSIARISIVR